MALLWLDLETTGLSATDDAIVEVAWTLTDSELRPITNSDEVKTMLVDLGTDEWSRLANARQIVLDMHTDSGLIDELQDPMLEHYSLEEIASDIMNEIDVCVPSEEPIYLAGASVHFDLGFIRAWMPELASRLSHRVYDTSTLKAFFEGIVVHGVENEGQHRAANDVREVLEVARRYRTWTTDMQAITTAAIKSGL